MLLRVTRRVLVPTGLLARLVTVGLGGGDPRLSLGARLLSLHPGAPGALAGVTLSRRDIPPCLLSYGVPVSLRAAFETAWRYAQGLRVPLALAQLEMSDARRLRAAGQLQAAVARLRPARQRLITLGARPSLQACDRELAAVGAPVGPETAPAFVGLTPAERAVARLAATGRSNRQTAAKLYVSVKTVEFHSGTSTTSSPSDPARTSSIVSAPPSSAERNPSGL